MRGFARIGIVLLACLVSLNPVLAQTDEPGQIDEEDPFLTLLGMVPDNQGSRSSLSYINYQAVAEVWNLPEVTLAEVAEGTNAGETWLYTIGLTARSGLDLSVLMTAMQGVPGLYPNMQIISGFTMLDVDQSLHYGIAPRDGILLTGEFDVAAMRAALAQRDFEPNEIGGMEVWCWVEGCNLGMQPDLENEVISDLFGGNLGRHEPLVITPELLLDSPAIATVEDLIAAQNDELDTLADAPEYRTFAEAFMAQGTLIQLSVFSPDPTPDDYDFSPYTWDFGEDCSSRLPAQVCENARNSIDEYFGDLPPYPMIGFAHVWREGEHFGLVALLYEDAETAAIAGQEIYNRLSNAISLSPRGYTYADMLGSEILPPVVYKGDEFAAAIVLVRAPEAEEPEVIAQVTASVAPYRAFMQMLMNRDLYFLGTEFILP